MNATTSRNLDSDMVSALLDTGATHTEIANSLGVPLATVKRIAHKRFIARTIKR